MGSRKKTEKIKALLPDLKDKHLRELLGAIGDQMANKTRYTDGEQITPKGQKGFNIPDAPGTATEAM